VQRTANELVDDRLAVFTDNPHHRRSPFLRLTPDGRRALETITAQAQRRHEDLAAELRGIDLVGLRAALGRLAEVVRDNLGD
jgi:DNA-binding MarR family transcriptional regulator